jgi:hypothetical protein
MKDYFKFMGYLIWVTVTVMLGFAPLGPTGNMNDTELAIFVLACFFGLFTSLFIFYKTHVKA